MIRNYSARLTRSQRNLLALLASSVIFSAGCANMATTAPASNPLSTAATLSGRIHGGNQPVIGATVSLWYAGQNGNPGFAPTLAATATTDSTGSFSFAKNAVNSDTLPSPHNQFVYLSCVHQSVGLCHRQGRQHPEQRE